MGSIGGPQIWPPGPHGRVGGGADPGLQRIVEYAAMEVPNARYASITVAVSPTQLTTPAATHPYASLLDDIEQRHAQGPCLSAGCHQHTVRIDDLGTDDR